MNTLFPDHLNGSVSEQKTLLRNVIRKQLRALDAEAVKLSNTAIYRQAINLPEYKRAKTVFAYVGVGWEIDTWNILRHALFHRKRLLVPLCVGNGVMEARMIRNLGDLIPGAYGIPEPKKSCPAFPPAVIDFAFIPCVTCDKNGMRLGQGGGYYDRFMADATFANAALCRDIALADTIPAEPWDLPVDCVVTETEIHRRKTANDTDTRAYPPFAADAMPSLTPRG